MNMFSKAKVLFSRTREFFTGHDPEIDGLAPSDAPANTGTDSNRRGSS
jgi:hypothetical protein